MSSKTDLERIDRITVVGGGVTGRAVSKTMSEVGKKVFLTDNGRIPSGTREVLNQKNIDYEEGDHTDEALDSDMLVVSPGVPPSSNLLQEARSRGIPVIGEIELAYRLSPARKIVAVTGTNGKTTTVKLIAALLNWAGENSIACGNIGRPYIETVKSLAPSDVPVVEVSSYQLQYVQDFRADIAVLLNIEPDHLKRHGSFENYRQAKLKIFQNQEEGDCALINSNIDLSDQTPGNSEKIKFSRKKLPGIELPPHQMENLGAAAAVMDWVFSGGKFSEIPEDVVERSLQVPHRLEKIANTEKITVINDSKATNAAATLAAINSLKNPINLLLGGKPKKDGYRDLAEALDNKEVRRVYLFGAGRKKLKQVLEDSGYERFEEFNSMKEATEKAVSAARTGEIILLSPACSSFDEFSDFEERGKVFKKTVDKLINHLPGQVN